jgi:hypothetical protein
VATTVSKPRKVPTLKAAALLKEVQDLITNDPKVADTIEQQQQQSSVTDATDAVESVAAEVTGDSAMEGDTDEEQEAQLKRFRGRPRSGKSRKTATDLEQLTDSLTIADPNEAVITDLEARHRRSARGRAVFAPTFLSYNWEGMDERMV